MAGLEMWPSCIPMDPKQSGTDSGHIHIEASSSGSGAGIPDQQLVNQA